MKIIDFHCDTISKIFNSNEEIGLAENNLNVDIDKLERGGSCAQFFALFIYRDINLNKIKYNSLYDYSMAMLDRFYREIEKNNERIEFAGCFNDLVDNKENEKISAFLTVEDGGIIEKQMERLRNFYRLGVRLITLTWNFPNSLGYPNSNKKYIKKGLTDFGKEVVEVMNDMGIIIDVSHLSDVGFYDVAEVSSKPFVASHSNSRALREHYRNLTDDMIKKIAGSGGVVGINFASYFLGDGEVSKVEDIVRHIEHILNVGGEDVVVLGTDFDGISCELEIADFSEMGKLVDALRENNFSQKQIEKICYKNAERVIREVMK